MTRRPSPVLLHAVNSTGATAAGVRMGRSNAGSINVHVCCNPVQPAVACCGATPVVLWGEIDFSESRVAVNSRDVDEVNRNAVLNLRGSALQIGAWGRVTFPPPFAPATFSFHKMRSPCAFSVLFPRCCSPAPKLFPRICAVSLEIGGQSRDELLAGVHEGCFCCSTAILFRL